MRNVFLNGYTKTDDLALLRIIPAPLLAWYDHAARILPWRERPEAYRVWVSEIMLQQTRVEAVKPYFERFMSALPDVSSLASFPEDQLLKLWQGLGYYNRARNLQKAAKLIVERYGGVLPASYEALLSLPGIGEYTAGAIASIAYNLPVPAVDGNVLRVTARLLASSENIADPHLKKCRAEELKAILPERAGDFNQAMMELGATVCLPNGAPHCTVCPLNDLCRGYQLGVAAQLPVKSKKQARREEKRTVFLLTCKGKLALQRRPGTGLLAKLWELPSAPEHLSEEGARDTLVDWGFEPPALVKLPNAKHIFTHLVWRMVGWAAEVDSPLEPFTWVSAEELASVCTLPHAFKAYFPEIYARIK